MNNDKIIELKIGYYKFVIGTFFVGLITLIGGVITSFRKEEFDFFFYVGVFLSYIFTLFLVYLSVKLHKIIKGLK